MKPRISCDFLGLCQPNGAPLKDGVMPVKGEVRAMVIRRSYHPRLGRPTGMATITSKVRVISFEHGLILTQNSLYVFNED